MKIKTYLPLLGLIVVVSPGLSQNSSPYWAKGAVWYEIVPERFRNAYPGNDPIKERVVGADVKDWQVHPWASDWYKLQIWESDRNLEFYDLVSDRRYGGDLIGVLEKLEYLEDLGVDVICLNSIFESPSILKQDVATFHHVDNNFGADRKGDWSILNAQSEDSSAWEITSSDEIFFELIEEVHKSDMKVVIEAAFAFCGREFWAFKDVEKNQQRSKYKDWFEVIVWDDPATLDTTEFDYECWQDQRNLPVFKKDENGLVQPVKTYIFDSTRRWMDPNLDGLPDDGIDGWLIAKPEGLDASFWREWIELVKGIDPQTLVVAETFVKDSSLVREGLFDTITNYDFANLALKFFARESGIPASEFDAKLKQLREMYSDSIDLALLNLVDSHETSRIASKIVNAEIQHNSNGTNHDFAYDPKEPDKAQRQIQKLMAVFQLTYLGAPVIYYGDESGMWGGAAPDNLKPMLWREFVFEYETYLTIRDDLEAVSENTFDGQLFSLYKKLTGIRQENPAIRLGSFKSLLVDDERNLYVYLRKFDTNEVVVVLNNSAEKQAFELEVPWESGTKAKDALNDRKYEIKNKRLKLELPRKWAAILVKSK